MSQHAEAQRPGRGPLPLPVSFTAVTMVVLLGPLLAVGLVAPAPFRAGIFHDLDFAGIWRSLPLVDDAPEADEYRRWSPWVECLSGGIEAARAGNELPSREAYGSSGDRGLIGTALPDSSRSGGSDPPVSTPAGSSLC